VSAVDDNKKRNHWMQLAVSSTISNAIWEYASKLAVSSSAISKPDRKTRKGAGWKKRGPHKKQSAELGHPHAPSRVNTWFGTARIADGMTRAISQRAIQPSATVKCITAHAGYTSRKLTKSDRSVPHGGT